MQNITYISAGAGSGKTYRLIHQVANLLENDKNFRPEQLILTTFTKKASAELKNKLRSLLCEQGKYNLADQIDNALIGTVHSIGFQLISKYWYYCGLSPKMNILADGTLKGYINSTLAECATPEDIAFFDRLIYTLDPGRSRNGQPDPFSWRDDVKKVIENAHSFGITDFVPSQEASLELIEEAYSFDKPVLNPSNLKDLALTALKDIEDTAANVTQRNRLAKAKRLIAAIPTFSGRLRRCPDSPYSYLSIKRFISDERLAESAYESENVGQLREHLDLLRYSPDMVNLYKEYVRRIFDIAAKWQKEYIKYKEKHNILDYNDIEKKMISLLHNSEVLCEIQSEYRYLLVDEFQDSNSNQIEIFTILSQNVMHSYWVGDSKQAIYGFRGTNTKLIERVAENIKDKVNGCKRDILGESRRSLPKLVEFANAVFSQVFSHLSDVKLTAVRQPVDGIEPLECVKLCGNNANVRAEKVAAYVSSLISDPRYERYLKDGKGFANFAILARKSDQVNRVAKALQCLNIPVSVPIKPKETREFKLLSAVLSLCMDSSNNLAKAMIAFLTSSDYNLGSIIDSKLDYDSRNEDSAKWLTSKLPIIDNIITFSKERRHLGVGAFVTAVIDELGLDNYSAYWKDGNYTVWRQLAGFAAGYESFCATLGCPATLRGFLDSDFDLESAEQSQNAVQVMTYHKSKGLAWPVVILLSLDEGHVDDDQLVNKSIIGVMVHENIDGDNLITLFPRISTDVVHDIVKNNLRNRGIIDKAKNQVRAEESRLLYVGVTRAADQLILVSSSDTMAWFDEQGLVDISMMPTPQEWEGNAVYREVQRTIYPARCSFFNASTDSDNHRFVSPSSVKRTAAAEKVADIGQRIDGISGNCAKDMANIGNCLHHIYCCIEADHSTTLVERLLEQYGMANLKSQSSVILGNWDALIDKLVQMYGSALCKYHELSFKHKYDGRIITGSIDLVWRTQRGDVLIDYKTFPGKPSDALEASNIHYAGRYAGQFDHYRKALEIDKHKVIDQLVFYPSIGMLVRIKH